MLLGCTGAVQMFPTVTSTPTRTLIIRNVMTRIPTNTASANVSTTPTITPSPLIVITPTPLSTLNIPVKLGGYRKFPEGGFAVRPIVGYEMRVENSHRISLESQEGDILISFSGTKTRRVGSLDGILTRFLEIFSQTLQDFEYGGFFPYTIDGSTGLATEISGIYRSTKVRGQVAIVAPTNQQLFYAIALSEDNFPQGGWEPEGRQVFETIAGTIYFFNPESEATGQ